MKRSIGHRELCLLSCLGLRFYLTVWLNFFFNIKEEQTKKKKKKRINRKYILYTLYTLLSALTKEWNTAVSRSYTWLLPLLNVYTWVYLSVSNSTKWWWLKSQFTPHYRWDNVRLGVAHCHLGRHSHSVEIWRPSVCLFRVLIFHHAETLVQLRTSVASTHRPFSIYHLESQRHHQQ